MKKDDMLEITIEDISSDGSGVGKADGFALFVKDTIPGDQVKVKIMKMKKRYGYARLMEILVPSPDRIQAPCPVARQCGGCQIQQMSYERQLTFKENKVCNNLRRLGGLDLSAMEVEPICGMEEPFHYRNKAQFPIGRDKNGKIIAGFYAGRTHSIIANTDCLLGAEENEAILNEVISWMEVCKVDPYDEKTGKGLVRHVLIRKGFTTKELMVCLVINGRKIPQVEKLVDRLQKIEGMTAIMANVNTEQTNVILGKEIQPIWGQDYIEDYIGNVKYRISPLSFYQVNPVQTEKLYGKALEYAELTGKETVWDLYCGIGTISLFLAQKAKQVVVQKIREEERKVLYVQYLEKEREVITGIVQRYSGKNVCINLGRVDAILMESEQVRGEHFRPTEHIKLYVVEVKDTPKGPRITVSRSHPEFVKRLFEEEVTEIQDGIVTIESIAREAGSRTKIAVSTVDPNVDAVGACVGMNGARVNAIVSELRGEKIDIINWNENPALLIENALSPAKVVVVLADVEEKTAKVVVPDYQLSLAIGKEGQNARLAARLTGFKIDIKSESQANAIEGFYEGFYDEDEDEEEAYDENEYAEGTVEDENAEE